jgi:hypothetical protein
MWMMMMIMMMMIMMMIIIIIIIIIMKKNNIICLLSLSVELTVSLLVIPLLIAVCFWDANFRVQGRRGE